MINKNYVLTFHICTCNDVVHVRVCGVCACARVRVCACARVRVCACARVRVCACAHARMRTCLSLTCLTVDTFVETLQTGAVVAI